MGAVEIVPDPARDIDALSLSPGVLAAAVASGAMAILGISLASAFAGRRVDESSSFLSMALNNLSQGVVIFMDERLVFCNERFLTLYGLPGDIIKPGCTLTDIFRILGRRQHLQARPGNLSQRLACGDDRRQDYRQRGGHAGRPRNLGRCNRPIPGGPYWIGSHEDITEQLRVERERASLDEQRDRRASIEVAIAAFRDTIATVLNTLSDSTATLRSTSTVLSSASGQTASQAAGAVNSSTDASANVGAAAAGAEQLLASISEIGDQLRRATELVQLAVQEANATNAEIAGLAHSAQEIGEVVDLIRKIAAQTNLLALNATIEAARAGESGAALPWSQPRSNRWRCRPPRPPSKSRRRYRPFRLPPAPPSKPFAAIPRACRKSMTIRRRSPPRSTSRTRPPKKYPTTSATPRRAPRPLRISSTKWRRR